MMPSAEDQSALGESGDELAQRNEKGSPGADSHSLEQRLRADDGQQLLNDLSVKGHPVRLTEPQARQAFYLAAKEPKDGLLPTELATCDGKTACDKNRADETQLNGKRFTNGDKVRAFEQNNTGAADEESALADATPAQAALRLGRAEHCRQHWPCRPQARSSDVS